MRATSMPAAIVVIVALLLLHDPAIAAAQSNHRAHGQGMVPDSEPSESAGSRGRHMLELPEVWGWEGEETRADLLELR